MKRIIIHVDGGLVRDIFMDNAFDEEYEFIVADDDYYYPTAISISYRQPYPMDCLPDDITEALKLEEEQ
jgi:hypothetical protein